MERSRVNILLGVGSRRPLLDLQLKLVEKSYLLCVAQTHFDLMDPENANVNEPHIDCCCGLMPFVVRTC